MAPGRSGLYYPNKFARSYLVAMEDVMGRSSLSAVLNMANLSQYAEALPPNNLDLAFDFADFTAINVALEELYGPRGGRGLALRSGRACFAHGMRSFGAMAGVANAAFRVLPLALRQKVGLHAIAGIFTHFSDQTTRIVARDDGYDVVVEASPVAWKREASKPVCHAVAGMIQEGLRWISWGHEYWVVETKCQAVGDEHCVFAVDSNPIG